MGLLLTGIGALLTRELEEAEVLNAFFTDKSCPQAIQVLEPPSRVCESKAVPTGKGGQNREHFTHWDAHNSMTPHRMHPRVLSKLSGVTVGVVFEM